MKYSSTNALCDFEFHDAELEFDTLDNGRLRVKAYCLNIHKGTEQNQHPTDMEIALAYISFEGFSLLSYKPDTEWRQDEHGEYVPAEQRMFLTEDSALSHFLKQLRGRLTVLDLGEHEPNTCFMDGIGIDRFFTALFTFESVTIEWDEYKKAAWYTTK